MTSFQNLNQATGQKISIDNQDFLFFGGTAYLGLLDNAAYISLYKEGIDCYGLNNGTSRSNNIQLGIYDAVEEEMARRFGFEASALFSSGYLAAQAAVRVLQEGKEVIYAPACHPALWLDGDSVINGSFDSWAISTVDYINNSSKTEFVVVSNCIDNLIPANFDFSVFANVSIGKQVLLILDDSHGIGIVHKNRISTSVEIFQKSENIDVLVVASLAKGLGTDAGVVLGKKGNLDKIKRHPMFLGASPPSPAAMYALKNGSVLYEEAFERLQKNIVYFNSRLLTDCGLSHIERFPVFSSLSSGLYAYLCQCNVLISSFPYPLSSSPPLNRIVLSALHSENDLDYLLEKYHGYDK